MQEKNKQSSADLTVNLENYQSCSNEMEITVPTVEVSIEDVGDFEFNGDSYTVYSNGDENYDEIPFLNTISLANNNGSHRSSEENSIELKQDKDAKVNKKNFDILKSHIKNGKTARQMGYFYFKEKRYGMAYLLFSVGDYLGDKKCTTNCGFMNCEGLGVKQNNVLGIKFYSRAVELGDNVASNNIMYIFPQLTREEKARCVPMIEKSIKKNKKKNKDLFLLLGRFFENVGDIKLAEKHYKIGFC